METDANAEAINTLTYIGQYDGHMKINTHSSGLAKGTVPSSKYPRI